MKASGFSRFAMSLAAFFACASMAFAAQVNTAVAVPSVITEKACLWLDVADAASFTLDAEGKVEKWSDKSGNGNDAVAYEEGDIKERGTVGLTNGVPAFLMGKVGSGIDLKFTSRFEKNIETVFQVMDIVPDSPYANFLGDETESFYRRGTKGQIFEYWAWNNSACYGATFRQDGVALTADEKNYVGCDTYFPSGTHVYTWKRINANGGAGSASCLSGDRVSSVRARNGGRAVSELIIFKDRLSDAEVLSVEAYLSEKWTKEPEEEVKPLVPTFLTKDDVHIWLDAADAESFTLDAGGKVEKWSDKSGNGNDAVAYEQAGATDGDKGICERGAVGTTNGVPAFLMGAAGSGIDLKFPVDTNIRTVFQVMDWSKMSPNAWFLASSKDVVGAQDEATGTGCEKGMGSVDFQRGALASTGAGAYLFAHNWKDWSKWDGWNYNEHIEGGFFRANKATWDLVADRWKYPADGLAVYALVTKDRAARADCLSGDRVGLDKSEAVGVSGGKAVSELIILDRALSEKEVYAVENYLYVKWRSGDAKATTTLSAATDITAGDSFPNLVLADGAALNVDFSDVAKGGTLCTVYGKLTKTATGKIAISASSSVVRECVLLKCAASEGISADSFALDSALATGYSLVWADNTLSLVRRPGFRLTIR